MFIAAGMLVLTRVEHPIVVTMQDTARRLTNPVLDFAGELAAPLRVLRRDFLRYLSVGSDLERMERELATLQNLLSGTSDLALRNAELTKLARLVRSADVAAITVEVLAEPRGLFGHSVTIGAGTLNGLRYGQPVFNEGGLFGRIVRVAETTAQVLVLNDSNSRIPVMVGAMQRPALMVGDNTRSPRLIYLEEPHSARVGDPIVSSGASGEFPRGIVVGEVVASDGELRVKTAARLLARNFLTVLLYNLPSSISDRVARDGSMSVGAGLEQDRASMDQPQGTRRGSVGGRPR